jgi:hypothetical protein
MSVKTLRATRLLTALAGVTLLAGCFATGSGEVRGRDRYRDRNAASAPRDDDENRVREVQGTVERVDPLNHRIDVTQGERIADQLAIYYEPRTRAGHERRGRQPQDLRPGDRIRAEVLPTYGGLMIQRLEVLSEARGGPAPEVREAPVDRPAPEIREGPGDREAPEIREAPESREDSRRAGHLRGTVRYVDTSARTLEIEPSPGQGRPDRVRVQYDDDTGVESQGKRYTPDNLQLGDRVEIDLRDDRDGKRLLAGQIVVIHGGQTEDH